MIGTQLSQKKIVPKNSKNQDSNGSADSSAAEAVTKPKKRSKATSKKPNAKAGAKKAPSRKSTSRKSKVYEPSDDEIRLRAYFIAERRAQMSLKGDPANDWLEARQQLLEEADQRKAAATSAPT